MESELATEYLGPLLDRLSRKRKGASIDRHIESQLSSSNDSVVASALRVPPKTLEVIG